MLLMHLIFTAIIFYNFFPYLSVTIWCAISISCTWYGVESVSARARTGRVRLDSEYWTRRPSSRVTSGGCHNIAPHFYSLLSPLTSGRASHESGINVKVLKGIKSFRKCLRNVIKKINLMVVGKQNVEF